MNKLALYNAAADSYIHITLHWAMALIIKIGYKSTMQIMV